MTDESSPSCSYKDIVRNNSSSSLSENTSIESSSITITDSTLLTVKSHTNISKRRIYTGLIILCVVVVTIAITVQLAIWTRRNLSAGSFNNVSHHNKSYKEILWEDLARNINHFMDEQINPCENFYEYACGGWKKFHAPMTDTHTALGVMTIKNSRILQKVFERKVKVNITQSERKARDFYLSCINQDTDESWVDTFSNLLKILNISDFDNYKHMDVDFEQFRSNSLSNKFLEQIPNLKQTSVNQANKIAWKCLSETILLFPDVTGLMFVNEVMPWGQDPKVYEIFSLIKNSYLNVAKTFIRENFKKKRLVTWKLYNVPLWNGYPQSIMFNLDALYESINISNTTYKSNKIHLPLKSKINDYTDKLNLNHITKANAFYVPLLDAVVLNAGMLQRPIYGMNFPNVINYAGLGFTFGHELSHAFSHYYYYKCKDCLHGANDPKVCLRDFYSRLKINGKFVNGSLTLKENFADVFGLHVAYAAYKKSKTEETLPKLGRFTHNQLFFIAQAQTFCQASGSKEKEKQYIENQLKNDTHSPQSVRILGMYSHSKEFAKAFNCPVGSTYNPVKKCNIF